MAKYKLLGQVSSASNTASSGTGSSRGWDQGSGASHPGRSSGCGSRVNSGHYSPMSISTSCLFSRSPKPAQEPLCGQPMVSSGLMPHRFSVWAAPGEQWSDASQVQCVAPLPLNPLPMACHLPLPGHVSVCSSLPPAMLTPVCLKPPVSHILTNFV